MQKRNRDREHQKRPKRHPKRIKIVRRLTIRHIFVDHIFLLRTNSFQSLEIGLRNTFLHDGNLPSTISLHKGWNFVPIVNIGSQSISTQGIVANEY